MTQSSRANKLGLFSLLAVSVACLLAYLALGGVSDSAEPKTIKTQSTTNELKPQRDIAQRAGDSATKSLPGVEKTENGFEFDDEMKLKLKGISAAYEEQIKYPSFSKPINPEELESKYLSDIPVSNDLPASLRDPDSPILSIKTNKLRYFSGDELSAIVSISGLPAEENSFVTATLTMDGDVLAHGAASVINAQTHQYEINFGRLEFNSVEWKQELFVETEFQFSGSAYQRSNSIEYVNTIASIDEVAPAEVNQDFLEIPVYISTEKPGFHRIRANLYDGTTGTPLVHLRAEQDVDSTTETLVLKAHISALKHGGSEGPYELKDLSLQRLPSKPDFITEFGRVDQMTVPVEGFSFSEYQDKPFIDEKAQRIAKELRRLGS